MSPKSTANELMTPLVASADELNSRTEWFLDASRGQWDNSGPFVLIKDNFYPDPFAVRNFLLNLPYVPYSPPSVEQVGLDVATKGNGEFPAWLSTAFTVYLGLPVKNPFFGARYNGDNVRSLIREVVEEQIDDSSWETGGDNWNGAGHLMNKHWKTGSGSIHHHFKMGDVEPRGWSGVVYLSPDAPASSGTSIWMDKTSRSCIASYGTKFETDISKFALALFVENHFNRLVLFRENVLHRAEHGFREGHESRLTQTFFFRSTVFNN